MRRVVLRRVLLAIPLLFSVSVLTFGLEALIPGDAARVILGNGGTQEQYAQVRRQLGLDQPLVEQYWRWLSKALRGDFGTSVVSGEPISGLLGGRLEPTLSLVFGVTIVAGLAGLALGVRAARGVGPVARMIDLLSVMGIALPNFWLGLVFIAVFAVTLRWFPVTGYVNLGDSVSGWLVSLVLPILTLALPATAIIAKQVRDSVSSALSGEYIRTLRAAGVSERSLLLRHALKNAGSPILTVIGIVFINSLGGTVLVESVFALPGLGGMAVQASTQHDVPLILGVTLTFTAIVLLVNLLVDLSYTWLDPRVRVS